MKIEENLKKMDEQLCAEYRWKIKRREKLLEVSGLCMFAIAIILMPLLMFTGLALYDLFQIKNIVPRKMFEFYCIAYWTFSLGVFLIIWATLRTHLYDEINKYKCILNYILYGRK